MSINLLDLQLVSRKNGVRAIASIEADGILMDGIEIRELSRAEKRLLITYPLEQTNHKHIHRVSFYPMSKEKKQELESFLTSKYYEVN